LQAETCREEDIDFTRFNLLEIASGDFGFFSQLLLRYALAHPFPTHIRAKNPDS
jgi:hypothetical protein